MESGVEHTNKQGDLVLLKILKKGETGNGNATKTKGASVFSRKLEHPNTADIKQFNTQDIETTV